MDRRTVLTSLASLIAAPAIVRITSLMPVKAWYDWTVTVDTAGLEEIGHGFKLLKSYDGSGWFPTSLKHDKLEFNGPCFARIEQGDRVMELQGTYTQLERPYTTDGGYAFSSARDEIVTDSKLRVYVRGNNAYLTDLWFSQARFAWPWTDVERNSWA